jgi:hypothetical protein
MAFSEISQFVSFGNAVIFAQPPDPSTGFVPLLLSAISVPSPTRVALNLTETENVTRRYTMVRNPVERVTVQNRLREPTELRITGMLSADPVFSPLATVGFARLDRVELRKLIKIVELSTCFVVTPERAYPNMGCTVLDEEYNANTGRGVRLTLQFQEFQIARPGLVEGEFDLPAAGLGAFEAGDLGNTTPTEIPA